MDMADLANASGWDLVGAARIYHHASAAFGFDRLRAASGSLLGADPYERQAIRFLVEDLMAEQSAIVRSVIASNDRHKGCESAESAQSLVKAWTGRRAAAAKAVTDLVDAIEQSGDGWSFAKLTIVNNAMRHLVATAQAGI